MPTLLTDRTNTTTMSWADDIEVASYLSISSMPSGISQMPTISVCQTSSWMMSTNSPTVDKESLCNHVDTYTLEEDRRSQLDPAFCREDGNESEEEEDGDVTDEERTHKLCGKVAS
ncbi:Uncharacterized protein SCF082_LOCUS41022 [Durusdinium trenchii]|uniref:Uncharacterized protein n=1 Tax=Durusdinium trenchii TaxID=1381693 RepID=A0ABP0QI87_9DINO